MTKTKPFVYPDRSQRDCSIAQLETGVRRYIAGRIVQNDGSVRLTDRTGSITLHWPAHTDPPFSGLVECRGRLERDGFHVTSWQPLTPPTKAKANAERRALRFRAGLVRKIRAFFDRRGFLEVETPLLVKAPGMEPHLRAFETTSERGSKRYLPTSPEYAMKRLLTAGEEAIYQVCKAFRDEPFARLHSAEFTLLEWYRAYASYDQIAADTETLVHHLALRLNGSPHIVVGSADVDLSPPWQRITVADAFRTYGGLDVDPTESPERFVQVVGDDITTFEEAFFKVFLERVEPHLGTPRPTILLDYPASMAALARHKQDRPQVAERFEVYIGGVELANAFGELNDPDEQRGRLEAESAERRRAGASAYPIDEAFLGSLAGGMPPSAGIALGVDRLAALLAGADGIRDVLAFPDPDI